MSNGSIASGLFWMEEEHCRMRQRIAELLAGRKRASAQGGPPGGKDDGEGARDGISLLPPLLFQGRLVALPRRGDAIGLLNEDLAGIMSAAAAGGAAWAESSIKRIQEMMRDPSLQHKQVAGNGNADAPPREAGMKSCRVKFDCLTGTVELEAQEGLKVGRPGGVQTSTRVNVLGSSQRNRRRPRKKGCGRWRGRPRPKRLPTTRP